MGFGFSFFLLRIQELAVLFPVSLGKTKVCFNKHVLNDPMQN